MNSKWTYRVIGVFLGAALSLSVQSFAMQEAPIGMPNPIVEYANFTELETAVGFRPLLLPKGTFLAGQYEVDTISSIDKKSAQVSYRLAKGGTFTIRSAKLDEAKPMTDISGVYTNKWKDKKIDDTTVSIAKVAKNTYAAHWTVDGYAFSLYGEQVKEKDFKKLLSEVLVNFTEDFYSENRNPMARQARF